MQGKRAFETAIMAARRKGWPDEEIARVTGLTVAMIEAVAGRRDSPAPSHVATATD